MKSEYSKALGGVFGVFSCLSDRDWEDGVS